MQAEGSRSSPRFSMPGAWIEGVLLLIMLFSLALSLRAGKWTDGLEVLGPIILGAFLLGVAMSFSRWNGVVTFLYSLIVGTVWVLVWVSQAPQIPNGLDASGQITTIGQSLWTWILALFGDEPVRNNLVFILELAFLMWWLGYLSTWSVFREGRVWRAIIPIGLVLLVNLYFGSPDLGVYFAVYVLCALLLAVRSFLSEREIQWRIDRVRYPTDLQFDFLRDGLILAVVVLAIALLLPNGGGNGVLASTLDPLRAPWQDVQREWGRLFSSLNYRGPGAGDPVYSDTLTLGGARNLGDTVIMDVRSTAGRYWRAVTFDTFTGRRWMNTSTSVQSVNAANHVNTPEFEARQEVTQTITVMAPTGNVLFAASQPLRVSLNADADLNVVEQPPGDALPIAEISMLHRKGADLRPGNTYLAVSSMANASIEELQAAGVDYPDWVRQTYLELPSDLSPQVAELAKQATAGALTPFDQAVALEQFLRTFPYNDQIPAPPAGVNAVNYFLFDVKQGYCDYYASSFAMMARTLGIPARVSAGYAQGEYTTEIDAYRVREYNGHSWPEVFFPGYGWVEFEPTASETEIVRQHQDQDTALAGPTPGPTSDPFLDKAEPFDPEAFGQGDIPESASADGLLGTLSGWWIGLGAMLFVVALVAFFLLRSTPQRQRRVLLDPQFTVKMYGRLVQWAQRFRLPLLSSQTPNEQAALLIRAVPEGRPAIESIAELYMQDLYSPTGPDDRTSQDAVSAWGELQPLLRRAWLRSRMQRIGAKRPRFKRRFSTPPTEPSDD